MTKLSSTPKKYLGSYSKNDFSQTKHKNEMLHVMDLHLAKNFIKSFVKFYRLNVLAINVRNKNYYFTQNQCNYYICWFFQTVESNRNFSSIESYTNYMHGAVQLKHHNKQAFSHVNIKFEKYLKTFCDFLEKALTSIITSGSSQVVHFEVFASQFYSLN